MTMSDLRELYQEVIIDHNRNPRHFQVLPEASHTAEGYNALCGDKLTLYLVINEGVIQRAGFQGSGCAISTASASLMTEQLIGRSIAEAQQLFEQFHVALTDPQEQPKLVAQLGKLAVLMGVREFPARVKCATLAWHTLQAALTQQQQPVSTE
jgi:nitrogen fixation protein NifU and related proteins